jgi:hypothetical protein
MGGVCSTCGINEKYNILVRKPAGKRALGKPRRRWKDNITMDPREIGWEVVDCLLLA